MEKRTLIIVRHGEAEQINKDTSLDYERQLTATGRQEAVQAGDRMRSVVHGQVQLLASAATRTQQTADLLQSRLINASIEYKSKLYHARPDDWIRETHLIHSEIATLILVGHNPTVSELCTRLKGKPISLQTGGWEAFEAFGAWDHILGHDWKQVAS